MDQENRHFYQKNRILLSIGSLVARKTLIFLRNFSRFFKYLPLGNFWSLLLIKIPNFVDFTPPYYLVLRGANLEGIGGDGPPKFEVVGRPMHSSPKYFEKY